MNITLNGKIVFLDKKMMVDELGVERILNAIKGYPDE